MSIFFEPAKQPAFEAFNRLLKKTFKKVLGALNNIASEAMLDEGRVYGGGLHKLESKELSKVPAGDMWKLLEVESDNPQQDFFNESRATALAP